MLDLLTYYARAHRALFSILVFGVLLGTYHHFKPTVSYTKAGRVRPFGIGYRHKTVVPVWVAAILLSLASFTLVLRLSV